MSTVANMKKKYFHQKLIRDKIPEKIKESGDDCKIRVLGKAEFEKELKRKLVEESKELIDAPKEKLLNELADVLELTKSIASHYKIPFPKVERFQEEKRKKRGAFKKKLFLVWSTGKAGRRKFLDRPAQHFDKQSIASKREKSLKNVLCLLSS